MKPDRMSQRIAGLWKRLTLWQRVAVAGLAVAVLAGLLAGTGVFTQERYATLFSGLEPQDAEEIVSALETDKVPYRLAAGGGTIMVPESQVYRVRLGMAGLGLPRGGVVGFELMDRTRLGSTDFEQRVSYLRALQGELARTIMQVSGVEQARVHIVLPEESLFVSQKRPATAAVLLRLRGGTELGREQVQGIVHLVSRSVEGLAPQDVTVVDTQGRILSAGLGQGQEATGVALTQLDVTQGFQEQLEGSLSTLLQQVFGPGNAAVRVSALLNFDEKVTEKSLFEPVADQEGIVRSVEELEESFKGQGASPGGVPGVDSNIPTYQAETPGGTEGEYERRETSRTMELNQITERIVVAPGALQRLSVSVVVNQELTPQQRDAVQSVVASAIGYDQARNDQITIMGLPFDTSVADEMKSQAQAETQAQGRARRQVAWAVGAAAALVGMVVLALVRRRAGRRAQEAALVAATAAGPEADELGPQDTAGERSRQELERLARQQPETVAQLVRTWLAEE